MVDEVIISNVQRNPSSLLWFIGPAVLVASFIFPSLYLRKILSAVFEDSLLTGDQAFLFCCDIAFPLMISINVNCYFLQALNEQVKRVKNTENCIEEWEKIPLRLSGRRDWFIYFGYCI